MQRCMLLALTLYFHPSLSGTGLILTMDRTLSAVLARIVPGRATPWLPQLWGHSRAGILETTDEGGATSLPGRSANEPRYVIGGSVPTGWSSW
jgi:hypothetical protein